MHVVLFGCAFPERPEAGVDRVHVRRALGLNLQAPLALYVGRLAEGKGLDTLLDAFAALRALVPAARLVLVGTGRLRAHLERRVLAAGLALAVRFAGEVPHHAVARWIRAADVLVLPSEAEGFPNVVREALACGRPVVATTAGSSRPPTRRRSPGPSRTSFRNAGTRPRFAPRRST